MCNLGTLIIFGFFGMACAAAMVIAGVVYFL